MPRKLWAASGGSYSDYRVYALFERKEDAEAYCRNGTVWATPTRAHAEIVAMPEYVEEFELHDSPPPVHLWWKARFRPVDGEVGAEEFSVQGAEPPARPLVFWAQEPPFGAMAKAGIRETPVAYCGDRDAAIKSVKDRMAALRARPGVQMFGKSSG